MLHLGIEHFNLVNRLTCKNGKKIKNLSNHYANLSPEMASILSNAEVWGPTKVVSIKEVCFIC